MVRIIIKGHEFNQFLIRDSYDRRALGFRNNIIQTLRKIGLTEDDVNIDLEANARINAPGVASWYYDGEFMLFSYKKERKYAENLYIVSKVIELEVTAFLNNEITADEFKQHFSEDNDIEKRRTEARKTLGVSEDCLDIEEINKNYKLLAKSHHPDAGGDMEEFKKINTAHKMLKRELNV